MKKYLSIITSALCVLTINSSSAQSAEKLRTEALEYSLNIVESYFGDDCQPMLSTMTDSLFILEEMEYTELKGKEDKLCESHAGAIRDKDKTYQDYLSYYKTRVLSVEEFVTESKKHNHENLVFPDDSFIFFGWELNEGKSREDYFIWDDMFAFVVSKVDGEWRIIGIAT